MHFAGYVKRSVLLDLAWFQCDDCDAEAGILRDVKEIEFRGVASPADSRERTPQRPIGRLFLRDSKAPSRTRALDPDKVPACLANHGFEYQRGDLFHQRPFVANGFLERIQTIRQDAPLAQVDGMQFHACAPFDAWGPLTMPEEGTTKTGTAFGSPIAEG